MNDDFLTAYRKPPSDQFVGRLGRRLRLQEMSQPHGRRSLALRPAFAVALAVLLLLGIFLALPRPRALLAQSAYRVMAGIFISQQPKGEAELAPIRLNYNRVLRWSELGQAVPFRFRLPQAVPAGYRLLDVAPVWLPSEKDRTLPFERWTVYAVWQRADQPRTIILRAEHYRAKDKGRVRAGLPGGNSSFTEVTVNGQPVASVCIGNVAETRRPAMTDVGCAGSVRLTWWDDEASVLYALEADGGGDETLADWLRMIESIR